MADEIKIPISSKYDDSGAKKALRDAKEIDKLKPEVKITADTKTVERDIAGLMTKVDKLGAEPATILLASNATAIAGDITDLIVDLDRLDASDPQVDVKAAQINSLKGDLDQIEGKIKSVNGIPVDINTKPAVDGIKKVHGEADQSRSVLANMVGNATQDLGQLGGVAGTAGVAIGQLGEYATEGNISLSGLAGVAGPMAALALTTHLVSSEFAKVSKAAEEQKGRVQQLFKAFQEGKTVLDAFSTQIQDTGKFELSMGDILPDMDKMKLSVAEFSKLVEATPADFEAWAASQRAVLSEGTPAYHAMFRIVGSLTAARLADTEATKSQEATARALGKTTAQLADEQAAAKLSADQFAAAMDATAAADERATTATEEHAQALKDQADALNGQVDAATNAADAQVAANKSFQAFGKVLSDNKATADDVRDAAVDLAKASQNVGAQQAIAAGKVQTSTQRLDAQNRSLLSTGAAASGPGRQGIINYIAAVNGIPPEKVTDILALMDQGKIAEANQQLAAVSTPRTASVRADADTAAADNELDRVAEKKRVAYIQTYVVPPGTVVDRGGFIGPDGALAAERRPELVTFPGSRSPVLVTSPTYVPAGSQVTSGSETERILAGQVGASPSITVNMRLPVGWRGDPLAEAHRTTRRAGRFYNRVGR